MFAFEAWIIKKIESVMLELLNHYSKPDKGLKTKDVREMLGCCANTLTALRISGKLRMKKVGGNNYYNREDVLRLLNEGFK